MQIKPAVRGSDKAARSSIFPRTRALRGKPWGPCGAQAYPGGARPRRAAQSRGQGRAAQGGHRASSAGGSPRGSPRALPRPAGAGGPAHLEEVVLVHHAAVGQGPHQPAGQGGLAAVGDPAARARPSGSATWGPRPPPTPTAAPGGAGMRDPRPSRSPSRFPRPVPALTRRCR